MIPAPASPLDAAASPADQKPHGFLLPIVGGAAFAHLLNNLIQATLPSVFPLLKHNFSLSFGQIGIMALVYQVTASLLQPWIGLHTDKHPKPLLLPAGMVMTLIGIALLATAGSYPMLLLAAVIIIPNGQQAAAWFMLAALLAILVLLRLTAWVRHHGQAKARHLAKSHGEGLSRHQVIQAVAVICMLIFAKFVYIASFTNYFTFYLIQRFGLSVQHSQVFLFMFLAAIAAGTFFGGPVGDRIGRKAVIWISFLGVAPFALALPHANLFWTGVLAVAVGLVMSSAFSAMVVYAQEAVPGRIGLISGLMFGLMFGIGGMGAAGLGQLADMKGIVWVYGVTSFLPLLGLATAFLPSTRNRKA